MQANTESHSLAGCVLLDKSRRVLLLHRAVEPTQWELPGGKVRPPETPADAARRELSEELGIDVQLTTELGRTAFEQKGRRWEYILFLCLSWSGKPQIREPGLFDDLQDFDVEQLREPRKDFSPNLQAFGAMLSARRVAL